MPRTDRRRPRETKRRMQRVARQAAEGCQDYDGSGNLVPVRDAKALAVLERGFSRLLDADFTPQVLKLSRNEGLAFPRQEASEIPESAQAWLAVGMDKSGCATYVLRWLGLSFPDPVIERYLAESLMFSELCQHVSFGGFPFGGRT